MARVILGAVALLYSAFHLYTSFAGSLPAFQQRVVHLTFALCLVFGLTKKSGAWKAVDIVLAAACVAAGTWSVVLYADLWQRGASPEALDIAIGVFITLVVLEGTRRAIGPTLPILSVLFIAYAYFGNHFPDPLTHRGHDVSRIINTLYISTEGIFGLALGASATVVAIYVVFAALLERTGGGRAFIDLAVSMFGTVRGGPAKIAVAASGLFGTVSGAAVANVVGTGTFTIPLMKRIGFRPQYAGAVEAAASTGGQLMPPVMGAAAFIMAEMLSIPYSTVCIAAAIPALLYYVALYLQVDSEAALQGIRGVPRAQLPPIREALKRAWHVIVPLVVLIYALVGIQLSEVLSAVYAIATLLLLIALRIATRSADANWRSVVEALEEGGRALVSVALTCACAGIVIGMVMLTGLGHELSSLLIDLAGGNLSMLLLITAVTSLILGMGLPTSACYILLAILVVPALVEFGVQPLAAHLFVFYVGLMANVTPPVALAAYAGAGIANADPFRTGFIAFRLSLGGFIVPFFFVFRPELLIVGAAWFDVVASLVVLAVALAAVVGSITGYLFAGRLGVGPRVLLGTGAVALIYPSLIADLTGFALVIGGTAWAVLAAARRAGGFAALRERRRAPLVDDVTGV